MVDGELVEFDIEYFYNFGSQFGQVLVEIMKDVVFWVGVNIMLVVWDMKILLGQDVVS